MTDNILAWGKNGHEREYCIRVSRELNPEMFDERDYVKKYYSKLLANELGEDYDVSNRGSRIEVLPYKELWANQDQEILAEGVHETVHAAVQKIFGETELVINKVEPIPVPSFMCPDCGDDIKSRIYLPRHRTAKHA